MGCNSSKGTEVVDSSKKPGDRRKSVESGDSSDKEEDDVNEISHTENIGTETEDS